MDARQILSLRPRLERFLTCFDGCFLRREQAAHLRRYVAGQMSDLPRKSPPRRCAGCRCAAAVKKPRLFPERATARGGNRTSRALAGY